MKTSLLYFPFFFLSLVFFACDTDAITFPDLNPDSILGHWDIDGGGTLLFEEENFSASAGCNTLFGGLAIQEETLTFSLIASTLIGCPEAEGNREQELAALFENAALTFTLEENRAQLRNAEWNVVLTLTRPENADLVNAWEVVSLRTPNAISSSILDEDTGITFFAKGTLDVQTSCNSGVGSYTTKEDKLTFTDLFFTERACEGERNTREQEFTNTLLEINSYSILRNNLTLEKDEEVWATLQLEE